MSFYPDRSESELNTFIPKAICYGNNKYHGQDYQECYQNGAVTAIVQADGTTLTRTTWRSQNGRIIPELLKDGPFPNAIHSGSASKAGVGAGLKIVEAWEKRREEVLTSQLNVGVYPWYGLYENIVSFLEQYPNRTYLGNSTLGIIAFNQETNKILYGGVGNQAVWLIFRNGKAIKLPFGNFDKGNFIGPFISSPTYAIHSKANIEDSRSFKLKEFDLRSFANDIEQGCAPAIVTDGFLLYIESVAVIDTERSAVADIMRRVSLDTENCLMESVNERAMLTGDDTHLGIIIIKPFEQHTYLRKLMIADGT
ncbi:MAG TPA: hypothetical protein PK957_04025 [Candidatus Dojkabacteria bacterium]|nr:hypothetical protein [Candidatus Dojkabacteria bacterium]HQF36233.1 hypothetical protein [Candidatus Dojkabacteria bacterium]